MSITPITLRIDTSAFEERMASFREHFRQYLEEREVQNEGRNEDHGCEGRRESNVGHGSEGVGGLSSGEIRGATAEWIPAHRFPNCNFTVCIRGDHGEEVARFRPSSREDRDDSTDGRWIDLAPGWQPITGHFDAAGLDALRRLYPKDDVPTLAAFVRAEALLLEHLDERQTENWKNDSSFDVIAQGGGTYKVDAQAQSVTDHANGVWYCLQPYDSMIPSPDVALAHKLWLEADETGFLKAANCFPLRVRRTVGSFYDIVTTNAPVVTHGESDIVFAVEDTSCL